MNNKKPALRVGIIGGGISGVALALSLCQHSHLEVQLFEAAPAFGEVGAGVSFGPNAVRAIAGLGLGEAYLQVADRTPQPWEDVWFEWRRGSDASYLGATIAPGVGQSSVHRADFLDALVRHLPEGIAQFRKRATEVEQQGGELQVLFADGTEYRCDLLIGADGIKSALRSHVLEGQGLAHLGPRFSGTCAFRGMVDSLQLREAYRINGIAEHLVDVPQMYLGLDGHILTFPVRNGSSINVVAFISDRSQPEPTWPADAPWVREVSQLDMLDAFFGWGDAARILLECIPNPTLWALHDLAELPTYVHGRVVLIGDAAHAMLPHQGAGAAQGLEDAYFLARLLGDPHADAETLPELLKAYDDLRRPRACLVQRTSFETGELYELRDPIVGANEQLLGETLATRFDWLWNHDLDTDLAEARVRMGWEPRDQIAQRQG
ncbi:MULTISPECIES: salicylate 1-monooxygenase [Pseudomonas]|uniref:salicylate 1-monooxygenase n=1 Tax=Pseudomonas TaxID=286 RepID=UPI0009D41CA5|nr:MULTISPECIES: salicylate 1-monooxygenase [unclassified Pseudomonas]OPK05587.1 salicylate 1-monooxygenase [Pseudomonas veronii]UHH01037.1 salicylate 1-monooxygenase [Pseudomonas sp. 7-41]WLD69451.1 salicylate 1-monooxygenase [Pseudomonas sp. OVF7]